MKIAVYSALYGQRDPINPDCLGQHHDCDRFLFTDNPDLRIDGVTVIHDPLNGLDVNRASRRQKLRPARYFPDHDWSIYLDNNASLLADPVELVGRLAENPKTGFAAYRHFLRDCAYEEAKACLLARRDTADRIKTQMAFYKQEGFPEHNGLFTGPFLIRRHDSPEWAAFGEHWFEQVLTHSRRDQLSCNYVAWKMGLELTYLDGDLRESPLVQWPAILLSNRQKDAVAHKSRLPVMKHKAKARLKRALGLKKP
ncbi:glycosyltransferase domain-containing protein [Roseobacter sp. MH60115]|uniref:glycosyltransferase domain-containing protein n=1 Tax=Roseobacter sp. MH60115 TaxID=2785324 RepID=UPI0018A2BADF|nr:glycosyltransferase domain-containing protein [Roseobacter sp. MH60115]